MTEKRGFLSYLKHKKFALSDFLEPLFFLPFGYELVRIVSAKFNSITFVLGLILIFIYLPIVFVFLDWRKK